MIRTMTIEDYEQVHDLWMKIHGFGIRSVDDSKEGVERFLKRNPITSVVAVEGDKIVGAIYVDMMEEEGVSIMSVWMKHTACAESEKQWLYLQWKH